VTSSAASILIIEDDEMVRKSSKLDLQWRGSETLCSPETCRRFPGGKDVCIFRPEARGEGHSAGFM
jgi:hypothetical protein